MFGYLESTHNEATLEPGNVMMVEKAPLGTENWTSVAEMSTQARLRVGELFRVQDVLLSNPVVVPEEKIVSIQDNSSGIIVETQSALYRLRSRLSQVVPEWAYGPVNFAAHASNNVANFATDYLLKPAEYIFKPIDDFQRYLSGFFPNPYEEKIRKRLR